jgi:hypothetical protein
MPISQGKQDYKQRLQHWAESINIESFIKHSKGKTLEQLRIEKNRADGETGEVSWGDGLGPVGHRYIRDPLDPPNNGQPVGVIDIRHFNLTPANKVADP